MKKCLILLFTFSSLVANAGDIIHLGETNPKARRIGEPPAGSHKPLKGPAPPKSRSTDKPAADEIKPVTDAPYRTWASRVETKLKAKITGISPDLVVLQNSNDKKFKINRSELSDKDQEYLNHYDKTGEFPAMDITKTAITILAAAAGLLFAAWFLKDKHKKPKYKTPKQNITIGTGL